MDIQNFECRKNWGYNTIITVADDSYVIKYQKKKDTVLLFNMKTGATN